MRKVITTKNARHRVWTEDENGVELASETVKADSEAEAIEKTQRFSFPGRNITVKCENLDWRVPTKVDIGRIVFHVGRQANHKLLDILSTKKSKQKGKFVILIDGHPTRVLSVHIKRN